MKKKLMVLLLAAATVITSCSKDDDNNSGGGGTTPVTNTSKLCNKNWKIQSAKFNGIDVTSQFFDPCELDNFLRFNTNGSYTADEGATKCDTASPQTNTGTWSWAVNETKLVIDGDTADMLTNSGTALKLGITDPALGTVEINFGL